MMKKSWMALLTGTAFMTVAGSVYAAEPTFEAQQAEMAALKECSCVIKQQSRKSEIAPILFRKKSREREKRSLLF